MNKLLDVARQTGFPWSAETAEAINSNYRFVESIMDGLNIDSRQAIILADNIMYIKADGWVEGKMVKVFTTPPLNFPSRNDLLENPNKYKLVERSRKISINKLNSTTEVYPDCILEELYEIVLDDDDVGWTFIKLADAVDKEMTGRTKYGTWTPTVSTDRIRILFQSCNYHKILNRVFIFGNLILQPLGGSVDIEFDVYGLPYNIHNTAVYSPINAVPDIAQPNLIFRAFLRGGSNNLIFHIKNMNGNMILNFEGSYQAKI